MAKHGSASTTHLAAPGTAAQGARLPAGFTYTRHIGRVGMLAVALGVGFALSTPVGIARADDSTSNSSSSSPNPRTLHAQRNKPKPATARPVTPQNKQPRTASPTQATNPDTTSTPAANSTSEDQPPKQLRGTKNQARQPKKPAQATPATGATSPTATPRTAQAVTPTIPQRNTLTATTPVAAKMVAATNNPAAATTSGPVDPNVTVTSPATTNPIGKLLAIPGSLITGIMNALKPILFQGGDVPANPPLVWALLAWTRRQFVNDAPQFSNATLTTHTTGAVTTTVDVNATDPAGDKLTYTAGSAAHGIVTVDPTGDGDGSTFTYTPSAGYTGTDTFTITASDKSTDFHLIDLFTPGGARTTTTTITVTANQPPRNGSYTSDTDPATGKVTGTATASDDPNDHLTFSGTITTTKGSALVDPDGTFSYQPSDDARHKATAATASDAEKQDNFDITVTDAYGAVTTIPVSIAIVGSNTGPTNGSYTYTTDASTGLATGTAGAIDAQNDHLTYAGTITTTKGTATVDPSGTFTYQPTTQAMHNAAADNATTTGADKDSFDITVTDGHGGTGTIPVSVTLHSTNSAPGSSGDPTIGTPATQDGKVTGTLNAADQEGDQLQYTVSGNPAKGTVTVNGLGTYTYTPNPKDRVVANSTPGDDYDSFAVTVTDGHGGTTVVTVNNVLVSPTPSAVTGSTTYPLPANSYAWDPATRGGDGSSYSVVYGGGQTKVLVIRPDGTSALVDVEGNPSVNGFGDFVVQPGNNGVAYLATTNGVSVIRSDNTVVNVALNGQVVPHEPTRSIPLVIGSNGNAYLLDATKVSDLNFSADLLVVRPDGTTVRTPLPGFGFNSFGNGSPSTYQGSLQVAADGTAYLNGAGKVWVISPGGALTTVNSPNLSPSYSLTVGADGRAYFVDAYGKLIAVDHNGTATTLAVTGLYPGFNGASMATDGRFFQAMYTGVGGSYYQSMAVINPNGTFTVLPFGTDGYTTDAPTPLPNGRMYTTFRQDSDGTYYGVVYSANNAPTLIPLGTAAPTYSQPAIAGSAGHVYVTAGSTVYVIKPDNTLNTIDTGIPVLGVVAGSNGRAFITSYDPYSAGGAVRVLVVEADGSFNTFNLSGRALGPVTIDSNGGVHQAIAGGAGIIDYLISVS